MKSFESTKEPSIPPITDASDAPPSVPEATSIEDITAVAEAKAKFEKITQIAQILADSGSRIKVKLGKLPDKTGKKSGWRYIFHSNTIEVDPIDILEKPLAYCMGIISHEAAHELVSRVSFITKDEWNKSGFKFLLNAVEDPRVNNWISRKYQGPRTWLKTVYNDQHNPANEVEEKLAAQTHYTPKHIKFGLEIIRFWNTGKYSDDLPDDVREVLEKTQKIAAACYNTLPSSSPSPGEISSKAQLVYQLVNGALYPYYKKLVEEARTTAELEEMIREMLENGDFDLDEGEANNDGTPIPLDQLPEDLRKKLEKKIKEKLAAMDADKRKKLEEKAKLAGDKKINDAEDIANKTIEGKFGDPGERSEGDAKALSEEETRELLRQQMADAEARLDELRSAYDREVLPVRPEIDDLTQFFINEFMSKRQPVKKPASSGSDINMVGAAPMRFEATGEYDELFLQLKSFEKNEFKVTLLVDLSGSMNDAKIKETFKGLAMVAEVLKNVGIPFSIYGFQDDVYEFKSFEQEYNEEICAKMMTMLELTGKESASCNSDGYCVKKVYDTVVLKNLTKTNLFFVFSDGLPAPGNNRVNAELDGNAELLEVIAAIQANSDVSLIGFGVGPDTAHVKQFYHDNVIAGKVKDVPTKLKDKLKEKIVI